jgi:hypothetical protein
MNSRNLARTGFSLVIGPLIGGVVVSPWIYLNLHSVELEAVFHPIILVWFYGLGFLPSICSATASALIASSVSHRGWRLLAASFAGSLSTYLGLGPIIPSLSLSLIAVLGLAGFLAALVSNLLAEAFFRPKSETAIQLTESSQ